MESEELQEEIDVFEYLNRFLKVLAKTWILVLILIAAGAGLNYVRQERSFQPYYDATAIFSVSSGFGANDVFTSSQYFDTAAASQLAGAFPEMLKTDIMRVLITNKLGTDTINGTITARSIAETNIFELTVRSPNPQDAYDILCAVIDAYPQAMVYTQDSLQIRIRQQPMVPEEPVNTFDAWDAARKGAILGALVGLLGTFGVSLLIRTVGSADELTKAINLPLLATFPHVELKKRRRKKHSFINAEDDDGFGEALRGLRTKVRKQLSEKGSKVVMLTSTLADEGKSTVSANLALSLAADGQKVVLVDADLRNQSIYGMFGSGKPRAGLMDYLRNPRQNPMELLNRVSGTELYYLSGISTNKRHYSVDGKSIRLLMDALGKEFDYIVLDSPPCSIISDAALLARFAGCVLYVVKQDHANKSTILNAVTSLYDRELPLTGCILNDVPRRAGHGYGSYGNGYGYGHYHYGHYHYGYGNMKKKK